MRRADRSGSECCCGVLVRAIRRRLRLLGFNDTGLDVGRRRGSGELSIPFAQILTAERVRSGRGFDLHLRGRLEPVRIRSGGTARAMAEGGLRAAGVRVVDCWGAILAPTLEEFEAELAREPLRMRQSSDSA
jgi:hypothetical protein